MALYFKWPLSAVGKLTFAQVKLLLSRLEDQQAQQKFESRVENLRQNMAARRRGR